MRIKKNHLGKKAVLGQVAAFALIFAFISIIYIFISVFMYAAANDYLFYNLQNFTEQMEADGIVKSGTAARTQSYGDDFTNFNLHLDDLWLIAYLVFLISSFVVSYKADRQSYFSFLGLLFYGIMFLLFILTIFSTLTTWFKTDILLKVIPTAYLIVPKFYYYLDNIGIFSVVHLVICAVLNMVDFDLPTIFQKKKREQQALEDEEIV